MVRIEVGKTYRWSKEENDNMNHFTIISIAGDSVFYKYTDGVLADATLRSGWFNDAVLVEDTKEDVVSAPSHYNGTKINSLDVVDDWSLDFYLGNVVKYIQRHTKKGNPLQDLKKAAQYLQFKIQRVEDEQASKTVN